MKGKKLTLHLAQFRDPLNFTIGESGPQWAGSRLLTRLFGSKHFVDFD